MLSNYLLRRSPLSTRERILTAAMQLFGEHGYAATTIAQIEQAAGLSPGAGGLYSHFKSKREVLAAGLDWLLAPAAEPPSTAAPIGLPPEPDPAAPLERQLTQIAKAGLDRLRHDRDYNRVLVRDLRTVPDLLELSADREIRPVHERLAAFLARPALGLAPGVDAHALAAVLIGATSHLWLMTDIFGRHPAGVTEDAYLGALTQLAAALFESKETS